MIKFWGREESGHTVEIKEVGRITRSHCVQHMKPLNNTGVNNNMVWRLHVTLFGCIKIPSIVFFAN